MPFLPSFRTESEPKRSPSSHAVRNNGSTHASPQLRLKISAPIPRGPSSLTGFDTDPPNTATSSSNSSTSTSVSTPRKSHHTASPSRPSNLAWLSLPDASGGQMMTRVPILPPPLLHRPSDSLDTESLPAVISRTVSLPSPSPGVYRLRMNSSTQSLDARGTYGAHPKPLSPIVEQDYFSPDSLRKTRPLPEVGSSPTNTSSSTKTPSSRSEIARPSPVLSLSHSPFLTRPLNRTGSQTSSRTHISTPSTTPTPVLPPLDLHPPFPGPHPSSSYAQQGAPLRPLRGGTVLPTIQGSVEGTDSNEQAEYDLASLHAESFFTASDSIHEGVLGGEDDEGWDDHVAGSVWKGKEPELISDPPSIYHSTPIHRAGGLIEFPSFEDVETKQASSTTAVNPPPQSPAPTSESFIVRRWDRFASFYLPFSRPKQPTSDDSSRYTPAFWAFWLGFFFPVLWFIGGWHFTTFGELPPKLTFWQFYFDAVYWRAVYRCPCSGRKRKTALSLPKWIDEKQAYYDQLARMNERKGSMKRRGFLFGYPFVRRPPPPPTPPAEWASALRQAANKPLWFFDQLYGVKLVGIQGRTETGRRMFDPWIQRCRYAMCYALVLGLAGTLGAATYLLVINIRQVEDS